MVYCIRRHTGVWLLGLHAADDKHLNQSGGGGGESCIRRAGMLV